MRGLYAIIDPGQCGGHTPRALAEAVLAGGCCALQLRHKRGDDDAYVALARPIREACREAGVPFFVNDRVRAVAPLDADGLHLGQGDMPLATARGLIGERMIGLSTHDTAQVQQAVVGGANLIGFGPVFATSSKENPDPVVGPALAGEVTASVPVPVVAIGGVSEDNVDTLAAAGVHVAAAIAALARSERPGAVAALLHRALSGA